MGQILALHVAPDDKGNVILVLVPSLYSPDEADKLAESIVKAAAAARARQTIVKPNGVGLLTCAECGTPILQIAADRYAHADAAVSRQHTHDAKPREAS